MPYVTCPRCGLTTYAPGGLWAEACPSCGTHLNPRPAHPERAASDAAVSCRLTPSTLAPTQARRALDHLQPRVGDEALDHLQLLVSELVTNSIRHGELTGDTEIALDVFIDDHTVYAEVHDDGVGFTPRAPQLDPLRSSGWGLWLLEALTHRWGIDGDVGTTAWFELRY